MKLIKKIRNYLLITIAILFVIRVIYVNMTYPSAVFHNVGQETVLDKQGIKFKINAVTSYSKEKWNDKISKLGIEAEAPYVERGMKPFIDAVYEQDHVVMTAKTFIGYNPDSDYRIIVVDCTITNTKDEDYQWMLDTFINITNKDKINVAHFDPYYTHTIQDINLGNYERGIEPCSISLKKGENINVKLCYADSVISNEWMIEHFKFANNQRMYLDVNMVD